MLDLIHRKERIVFTAIDVMNESGVQALSTKKIAQYQKISESTVFKHFENKNNILLAVLDFYNQYDRDLFESIKLKALKGLDGIHYLCNALMTYYENYPAITAITQGLDEMRYIEALAPKAESIIRERTACFAQLLEEARELGQIRQDIRTEIAAELIFSVMTGTVRCWRLDQCRYSLMEKWQVSGDYMINGMI